jgi:hypothetical protein
MSFTRTKILIITLAFAVIGMSANAQVERNNAMGYIGGLVGYADPTGIDGRLGYGVDFGMIFPSGITGLLFAYNSTGETENIETEIMVYGLGVDYSLSKMFESGFLHNLKAGVKVGMANLDVEGADDESDFTFGPSLGMDHMITEAFSVGGQADLLFVTGDEGYSTLYLFVTGKYWL